MESSLDHVAIAQAQRSELVLFQLVNQLEVNQPPQTTGTVESSRFIGTLKLFLQYAILYPKQLQEKLLCHSPQEIPSHGSQCYWPSGKTLTKLLNFAYWIGIAKDASQYHTNYR